MSADTHLIMGAAARPPEIMDGFQTEASRLALDELAAYLHACLPCAPRVLAPSEEPHPPTPLFVLGPPAVCARWQTPPPPEGPESYTLHVAADPARPTMVCAAHTEQGLKRAVRHGIRLLRQDGATLRIAPVTRREKPWIPEREWTLCSWEPQWVRAQFTNPRADARMNVLRFPPPQLRRYVALMDQFGFTGVQVLSQCYNWQACGSIEAYHDTLKQIADLAHERGQAVSLWVWAAQFNGYGWVDPDVVYTPAPGLRALDDPRVRRTFEKYYARYADLAPFVDRVIGHFFDPGMLTRLDDAVACMRLLEETCRAKNPNLKFAIDTWNTGPQYAQTLREAGLRDYLVLENNNWDAERRRAFRGQVRAAGLGSGIWGWYATEMESDQKAALYVNARALKDLYQGIKTVADETQPTVYWSEMEACHLINLFSVYAAAQLLWDPDQDPSTLLREVTEGLWGPRNGPIVLDALELIQDTRSGPTWRSYWVEHRLGTEDPAHDAARATQCLQALHGLRPDPTFQPKFTLPVEPAVLVELMLPHLEQIRLFAQFRLQWEEVRKAAAAGADKTRLAALIDAAWQPIPEFTTWIGTCGVIEAHRQEQLVRALCAERGIPVPLKPWRRAQLTARLLEKMADAQKHHDRPVPCSIAFLCDSGFNLSPEETADLMRVLTRDGVVLPEGPDTYILANWKDFPDLRFYGLSRLSS